MLLGLVLGIGIGSDAHRIQRVSALAFGVRSKMLLGASCCASGEITLIRIMVGHRRTDFGQDDSPASLQILLFYLRNRSHRNT